MTVETVAHDSGAHAAPVPRPLTGAEYLESLRDGREIWIYGARVADVTTHPAFRNTVRMIARLYDALHDPARKDILTTSTDTGSGVTRIGSSRDRGTPRIWSPRATPLPNGRAARTAGSGEVPTTKPRFWQLLEPTPAFSSRTRRKPLIRF